ncbi:MAG: hypothetical protein WD824_19945 [Cyclobacteriaceae bacterium]
MKMLLVNLAFFTAFPVFSQTIYIANNNPGAVPGVNVFTGNAAIGDEIAAASDGDFIYVTPSGTIYNATNITKSLTIFGAGFNPDKTNAVTSRAPIHLTCMELLCLLFKRLSRPIRLPRAPT